MPNTKGKTRLNWKHVGNLQIQRIVEVPGIFGIGDVLDKELRQIILILNKANHFSQIIHWF